MNSDDELQTLIKSITEAKTQRMEFYLGAAVIMNVQTWDRILAAANEVKERQEENP